MKLNGNMLSVNHSITDADTYVFLKTFDEFVSENPVDNKGIRVIEIGAHDEPVANILAECGCDVTGVDLREYNPNSDDSMGKAMEQPKCNYNYLRADFCNLPEDFLIANIGKFDTAISISAIEHFGLGGYGERTHWYYDVVAMRQMWQLLKMGGTAYVTVPYGNLHLDIPPFWRSYSHKSLQDRLVQDFNIEHMTAFVSGRVDINGKTWMPLESITVDEVNMHQGSPPHISCLVKLRKVPVNRIAKDGR